MLKKLLFPLILANGLFSLLFGTNFAFFLICIGVGLLQYYKNSTPNVRNAEKVLQAQKTAIIAHRGGALDAPENTLISISQAKKNGADAVEFDLEFTSDGVPILLHDDTLDRTTDGSGPIAQKSYEEVQTLNASAKYHLKNEYGHETVPTLDEAVQLCLELDLKMYIDVKGDSTKATDALLKLFKQHPTMYENAIVCSFNPLVVYKVRRADPGIVVGLTHRSNNSVVTVEGDLKGNNHSYIPYCMNTCKDYIIGWCIINWLWYFVGSSAYLAHIGDVSKVQVQYFKDRGISVVVWTTNARRDKDFIAKTLGCSYITDTLKT